MFKIQRHQLKASLLFIVVVHILLSCTHLGLIRNNEQQEIENMYMNGFYEEAEQLSVEYLKNNPDDILVNHYLGKSLFSLNKIDDSKIYFEKSIQLDDDKSWVSAWSYLYLGDYFLENNNIIEAINMYNQVIDLDKTENSVTRAKKHIFYLTNFKSEFTHIQTEHINFYFEKYNSMDNIENFIMERERAFKNICSILEVDSDFNIDFYVWDNQKDVYDRYGVLLGFSISEKGIIHSVKNQTIGHEITHTIVFHIYNSKGTKLGLINEGIAVYFDNNDLFPIELRINSIEIRIREKIDIKQMWENWGSYEQNISYPISGAFVGYLIEKAGMEKMILLLENQSYSNAKTIYGPDLDLYIEDFEQYIKEIG